MISQLPLLLGGIFFSSQVLLEAVRNEKQIRFQFSLFQQFRKPGGPCKLLLLISNLSCDDVLVVLGFCIVGVVLMIRLELIDMFCTSFTFECRQSIHSRQLILARFCLNLRSYGVLLMVWLMVKLNNRVQFMFEIFLQLCN